MQEPAEPKRNGHTDPMEVRLFSVIPIILSNKIML